jgi:hypothetical protein
MRISWRGFLIWVALAAAIIAPWAAPLPDPSPSGPAPVTSRPPPDPNFESKALTALPETTARPLFTATRRPPPPARNPVQTSARPKPTRLVGYRLTGIVRSSTQRMILLTEEKSGRVVELHEGEQVDGWRLTTIGPDHARLSRDGHQIDLLEANAKAPGISGRDTRWLPSAGGRR